MTSAEVLSKWTASTVEGRWCGFGPYYAMFPVDFVRRTVDALCPREGRLLDPFCGRGTSLFVAATTGREALGADVNPVAWVFAAVKLDPCARPAGLLKRVGELLSLKTSADAEHENEFQKWAWHSDVLAFLKVARRTLNWRHSKLDRTLMGIILVHLHGKLGEGLSNQMRQSKAMAPKYSVRWWKAHKLKPPKIDVAEFFFKKLAWRYHAGVPEFPASARVWLGDSRQVLSRISDFGADLVLTSPPYAGVTNYTYDNWMRLWMLGGPSLPSPGVSERYADPDRYEALLEGVFSQAKRLSKPDSAVFVRTHSRRFTVDATLEVLQDLWPKHTLYYRYDGTDRPTQTRLFQKQWTRLGEVDLLLLKGKKNPPPLFTRV
jgi:DNA methylase